MQSALKSFKSQVSWREINLDLIFREDLPAIHCDPERMEMALKNLIDNSIKVLPPGGELELSVEDKDRFCLFNGKG